MQFYHKWIHAFLVLAKAPRHDIFLPYMTNKELLLYSLLFKEGGTKITAMLCQNGLMRKTKVYITRSVIGGARDLGKV